MVNHFGRKMWSLGIQGKFALVAILLVLGTGAYALYGHLFPETRRIVVEHELVDLADEAELRCWEMLDAVNQLKSLSDRCAGEPGYLDKLMRHLNRPPGPARAVSGFPLWYDSLLSVRLLDTQGKLIPGAAQYPAQEAMRFKNPDLPEIPPTVIARVTKEIPNLDPPRDEQIPVLSEVLRAELREGYARAPVTGRMPEETAPLLTIPVIWAVCRMDKEKAVAILMPLERSRSSRHLSFLIAPDRKTFLQHPAISSKAGEEHAEPFDGVPISQEILQLDVPQGWAGLESDLQVQRGGPPVRDRKVLEPLYYLEGEVTPELAQKISAMDKADKKYMTAWSDARRLEQDSAGVRFGGAGRGASVVRLLARSQPGLDLAQAQVDRAYQEEFKTGPRPVDWHTTMKLRTADSQLVRFFLRLGNHSGASPREAPYYFVYAAFREELAASVEYEFREVRRTGLLLSMAAGGAAFLVAMFFVRPLRRITRAAQAVTDGSEEGDGSRLQHQVEAVRQSLPVNRQDEVGDIARALGGLLRQVNNGHERLRQLNADLENRVASRTAELSEANTELRGLAAAKDAFLASVSHELRQPLNSIFGYLQFLETSSLDAEQTGDVAKVRMAATYLRRLIDDILDYQKIIMGGIELEPEPLDGAEFFTNLRDSMLPQAAERRNALVFEGIEDLGIIRHDRARLQQILVNLLSNSCKFTQNGIVTLTTSRSADASGRDWLSIEVADNGRGMTPAEQKLLFTKFKKLTAREGNKTGTGLGLVICKGLCELAGGSITFESKFGEGTTFTVRLPAELEITNRRTEVPPPPTAVPIIPAAALPDGGSALVLVIDDDPAVRQLMSRYLEGKGYRVLTAADGEAGLALARKEHPAVITLDVVLPGRDGWEVLATLKSTPETADIPVLMVTFIEESAQGYTLGAADYLVKPVMWDDLSRRLARLTGAGDRAAPVMVVDDDEATRELFRRALEQDGRSVIEAADGAAAMDLLATHRPSLILLDLMMPVMDGFEFVEAFRTHEEWKGIPIVIVTAKHPTSEDRARLSGSVRTILEKGGSPSGNLLKDILVQIHRHAPSPSPPTQF